LNDKNKYLLHSIQNSFIQFKNSTLNPTPTHALQQGRKERRRVEGVVGLDPCKKMFTIVTVGIFVPIPVEDSNKEPTDCCCCSRYLGLYGRLSNMQILGPQEDIERMKECWA
jgi:hypothetical protein